MKLLIDIDKEKYDWIKKNNPNVEINSIVGAIAQGIPYEERPPLKDSIIEAFNQITDQEFEHSDSFWIVTPKGKKIEFEKKRPQGEWEEPFKHNGKIYHRCNHCHVSSPLMLIDNYCSYCGAEMRKGGEEE